MRVPSKAARIICGRPPRFFLTGCFAVRPVAGIWRRILNERARGTDASGAFGEICAEGCACRLKPLGSSAGDRLGFFSLAVSR
jgi:hypothetical protein